MSTFQTSKHGTFLKPNTNFTQCEFFFFLEDKIPQKQKCPAERSHSRLANAPTGLGGVRFCQTCVRILRGFCCLTLSSHVSSVPPSSVGPFLLQRGQTTQANGRECPNPDERPAESSPALQKRGHPESPASLENRVQLMVAADPEWTLLGLRCLRVQQAKLGRVGRGRNHLYLSVCTVILLSKRGHFHNKGPDS